MGCVLPLSFFDRDTLDVACDLLGTFLVRRTGEGTKAAMITEVEAYTGPDDLACHASRGRTKRTEALFGPPGRFYVYLVYGMHWMLNVVTREAGHPAAVLLRGTAEATGPARLTRHFGIDGRFHNRTATRATGLWFEDRGIGVPPARILRTPRIGVAYAGEWAAKPYRFLLSSHHLPPLPCAPVASISRRSSSVSSSSSVCGGLRATTVL